MYELLSFISTDEKEHLSVEEYKSPREPPNEIVLYIAPIKQPMPPYPYECAIEISNESGVTVSGDQLFVAPYEIISPYTPRETNEIATKTGQVAIGNNTTYYVYNYSTGHASFDYGMRLYINI